MVDDSIDFRDFTFFYVAAVNKLRRNSVSTTPRASLALMPVASPAQASCQEDPSAVRHLNRRHRFMSAPTPPATVQTSPKIRYPPVALQSSAFTRDSSSSASGEIFSPPHPGQPVRVAHSRCVSSPRRPFHTFQYPLQHAHVLPVTWHRNFPSGLEPVDVKNLRRFRIFFPISSQCSK